MLIGNHALAVAHAGQIESEERSIKIPIYVVLPSNCPTKKVEAAKRYGATIIFAGTASESRIRPADSIQKFTEAALVLPADQVDIVLSQGTAVGEILGQVSGMGRSPLDVIIVPSGGRGLLVGAAAVCRSQGVRLFGPEPECGVPGLTEALRNGMPPDSDAAPNEISTIADGLRSSTGVAN
jgi:threonine dehydratase